MAKIGRQYTVEVVITGVRKHRGSWSEGRKFKSDEHEVAETVAAGLANWNAAHRGFKVDAVIVDDVVIKPKGR